jgi:TonB family protein
MTPVLRGMKACAWVALALGGFSFSLQASEPSAVQSAAPAAVSPTAYRSQFAAVLQSNLHYPPYARQIQAEGTAWVRVRINRAGEFLSVVLIRSSGHESLDAEAMAVWARMSAEQAWIPVPDKLNPGQKQFAFDVPVNFALEPGAPVSVPDPCSSGDCDPDSTTVHIHP